MNEYLNWETVVITEPKIRAGQYWVPIPLGTRGFLLTKPSRPPLGSNQPSIQ